MKTRESNSHNTRTKRTNNFSSLPVQNNNFHLKSTLLCSKTPPSPPKIHPKQKKITNKKRPTFRSIVHTSRSLARSFVRASSQALSSFAGGLIDDAANPRSPPLQRPSALATITRSGSLSLVRFLSLFRRAATLGRRRRAPVYLILPSFLPSVLPSFLPSFLLCFGSSPALAPESERHIAEERWFFAAAREHTPRGSWFVCTYVDMYIGIGRGREMMMVSRALVGS